MMSKFEIKYGKYAISNLSLYLILGYVIGYMVQLINENLFSLLTFNPHMIIHGQVWRVFTWILVPPQELGIFTIFMLFLYYQLGKGLEMAWGTYRYNVFIFSGFIFTIVAAIGMYLVMMILYHTDILPASMLVEMFSYGYTDMGSYFGDIISLGVSTYYINMSIFLAYSATYPEEQLLLYFIIPIKIKWLGIVYGLFILIEIITAFKYYSLTQAIIITLIIVASLLNVLIYLLRGRHKNMYKHKQVKRRFEYKKSIKNAQPNHYEGGARHKCAVCGRTELDCPDLTFRYCSKCSGNKEYCQDHLFTHMHN